MIIMIIWEEVVVVVVVFFKFIFFLYQIAFVYMNDRERGDTRLVLKKLAYICRTHTHTHEPYKVVERRESMYVWPESK